MLNTSERLSIGIFGSSEVLPVLAEIPVTGFDYKMPVSADTTAMSTPHLIDYTLTFDSASLTPAA